MVSYKFVTVCLLCDEILLILLNGLVDFHLVSIVIDLLNAFFFWIVSLVGFRGFDVWSNFGSCVLSRLMASSLPLLLSILR